MDEIPRRSQYTKMIDAEKAITMAIQEVEKAGASVKLTLASLKLIEARELVADFVDGKEG